MWRYTGLVAICPIINFKIFLKIVDDERYEQLVMKNHADQFGNTNKAFNAVGRAMKDNVEFLNSTEKMAEQYASVGSLAQNLKMYDRENILKLSLVKAIEPKITAVDRDQNEAQALGKLFIAASRQILNSDHVEQEGISVNNGLNFDLIILKTEILSEINKSPYPVLCETVQSMITQFDFLNEPVMQTRPKAGVIRILSRNKNKIPPTLDIASIYNIFHKHGSFGVITLMSYYTLDPVVIHAQ